MTPREALQRAVKAANGTTALASRIGGKVVRQNIEYWLKQGSVPAEHAPSIERATRAIAAAEKDESLIVTCEQLCPAVAWAVLREQAA